LGGSDLAQINNWNTRTRWQ